MDKFAFDTAADDYDETFSSSLIGGKMRRAVWRRLDRRFRAGDRVLDLGCGTGEDAVYLAERGVRVVAADRSAKMVEVARRKVEDAGLRANVDLRQVAIEDFARAPETLAPAPEADRYDGALSNFGALNCVDDLPAVAGALALSLRPGATAALCVMGPLVPWEWAWFLARLRPREAFRRLRRGGVLWRGLKIRYPTIGALRRAFEPAFEVRRLAAVGVLLPPSYAETWAARYPRMIDRLDRWERRLETLPPMPWLADHYLVELERTA